MPRRKQQAPQRSVAYGPDDDVKDNKTLPEDEHLQDDGLSLDGQEGEYLFNDDDDLADHFSCQNSPLSNGTNPDAGYASPLSNSSEQLADIKTPPPAFHEVQEEKPAPAKVVEDKPATPAVVEIPEPANGLSLQDSLEQMKAVYANLISEASWSSIAMDMLKSKQGNNLRANTHNGRNHKGSNGFLSTSGSSSHSQGNVHVKTSSSSTNSSGIASMSSTNTTTTSSVNTSTATSHSNSSNSMSNHCANNNSGGVAYDWHQAALAKTLQHTPYHLLPEPSLFSTVQLYRQNNKLYGPVFTGASKFRCKDCSGAYDTLVGLTVHMNESGHYRDDNKDKEDDRGKRWSKPRKRSLMEMEGKEDAQKVLKCMYCGHSFESLQDLSVHMIKTKHYQKVPLKEPMPTLTSKMVPPSKKRPFQELVTPSSPESGSSCVPLGETPKETQKLVNPYVTANNRYGYQNGASYTWQFEARKAQILKCMECGSSHDTLQQLTAHMMVTGHFLKVTNSASKKGKQLVFDPVVEEKFQSIPLPPTTTRLPAPNGKPESPTRPQTPEEKKEEEQKQEEMEEESMEVQVPEKKIKEEKEDPSEKSEKVGKNQPHKYLTEADLEEAPKGGVDILKSLENAVSSAISKAQTGAPTWGGYTSIHAAYQLHGALKSTFSSCAQVQPLFSSTSMKVLSSDMGSLIHSPNSPSPPPNRRSNMLAMEELVEKVTGKSSVKREWEESRSERKCKSVATKSPSPPPREKQVSPKQENLFRPAKRNTPEDRTEFRDKVGEVEESKMDVQVKSEAVSPEVAVSNGCNKLGIITDHSPEQPLVNPLSALQSIMNNHLGKAAKVSTPFTDPFSMLHKLNNNINNSNINNTTVEKPLASSVPAKQKEPPSQYHGDEDQPMDLTKSKNANGSTGNSTSPALNNSHVNSCKRVVASHYPSISPPLRENALMDISDMVKNLTGRLTPKSTTPSSTSEKSDMDSSVFEEGYEDLSPIQRRKGRQSNWNPQHLLILQAQFASSLRDTPEGKLIITDLGPQERVHICKFTGLSMTTISHWLANVKYQLKRTGSTKFLKNIDTGHPLFLCSDCASQYRTPSSYIAHLESHLGFTLNDLSKLSIDLLGQHAVRIAEKTFSSLGLTEQDTGSVLQCKMCSRTFVSKHAIKLHLCKSHGKSPEDHLLFVKELEKTDNL
ncbi:teashirt homolog 1-like [Gadus chalcogrammus]|uniref:teashirt homolog 1-like n=1 Tax=Gadus chalcogrammus TaxID=1042646 RepID=UPI0024C4C6CF|nr:teashirt homolog 1-like [Gadus chalcogrammus]